MKAMYPCGHCGEKLTRDELDDAHDNGCPSCRHAIDEQPYKCEDCQEELDNPDHYYCDDCNKERNTYSKDQIDSGENF
jgi:DNA-directed RNA polymerase subunit RPC12/RpoP